MREEIINGHQVQTDGRTVWVNGPEGACRARFCPVSVEVTGDGDADGSMFAAGDWPGWVAQVHYRLGFWVPESFRPNYAKLTDYTRESQLNPLDVAVPIPMVLHCPNCHKQHLDVGEWATKRHRTHLCENTPEGPDTGCRRLFRPANISTVGVRELPGGKVGV